MRKTIIDIAEFHARLAGGKRPKTAIRLAATDALTASATEERIVSFVFSDNTVDRYGDVIDARGWQLDNFAKSPVALFGHRTDAAENVIGKARNVRVDGTRLIGEIEFAGAELNPTAETVYQMVKGGFLTACSVGFAPVEWSLSKEKGRQGGIDFKRQELLEISVVPVPANPNALALAKAAGIDVDRLGPLDAAIARDAPISKKGLYACARLADLLSQLGWLEDDVAWEAEYEGDGSAVPQMLTDAMKLLGQALVAMTVEEVNELLGEEDGADPVIIMVDPAMMEGMTPAQKAFAALARGLQPTKPAAIVQKDAVFTADELLALRALVGPAVKAGKVLSAATAKSLLEAHDMITKGCGMIKDMVDASSADPQPADDSAAKAVDAKAARGRRARALRQKIAA